VDPRVRRTRQLIMRAFGELLREQGLQAVTVRDIAERATVNRATFYAHFEDKFALLEEFARESFRRYLSTAVTASPALTAANLRLLAIAVFAYLRPLHGATTLRATDTQVLEPLFVSTVQLEEFYLFLVEWLRTGLPSRPAAASSPETFAAVVGWAIFGAGVQWARGRRQCSAEEAAGQVVAVLISGLSGEIVPEADG